MSEAEKAKAFDKIYAELKTTRNRTNLDDWTIFLDKVIRKFEWELIKMERFDRCVSCGKRIPIKVATWAYKKKTRWYCEEHYISEKKMGNVFIEKHDRSFKMMVKKNGGAAP